MVKNYIKNISDLVSQKKQGDFTGFSVDDLETQVENINGNPEIKNVFETDCGISET